MQKTYVIGEKGKLIIVGTKYNREPCQLRIVCMHVLPNRNECQETKVEIFAKFRLKRLDKVVNGSRILCRNNQRLLEEERTKNVIVRE